MKKKKKKSRTREIPTLSTDADSSTDYKVINIFHFLNPYLRVIFFGKNLNCHNSLTVRAFVKGRGLAGTV